MIRRPPRSTQPESSAASDVYKRQVVNSKTMWQYVENAEELLATKYGSDPNYQKLLYDLKCDRFAKAKQGLSPYYNMVEATKVIDATPQDIQDAMRHIPMRS